MSNSLLAASIVVAFAFFVRSFSGFGGALLSIPLLAHFFELKFIVPVECTFEVALSLILVPKVWRKVHSQDLALMLGGALGGSFVGIYMLKSFADRSLKIALGIMVILLALTLFKNKPQIQGSISSKWGALAGIIGGVLGGMFGTSGPAYVTYLAYQKREKHAFRATLILLFGIEYSWRLAVFIWEGLYTFKGLQLSLWLAPSVVLATIAGHLMHFQVNERIFRWMICSLLILSGVLCFL